MTNDLKPPPESAITPEDWQQTPVRVQVRIGALCAEVKQLRETVEQLQEIANRNSQNSSQPPSQVLTLQTVDNSDQGKTRVKS
jgi:hypothetical protein